MSVRYALAALLLGGVAIPAAAQDAQSLVAKNLEARGGAAALDAIKSISFEGRTIFPGDFELTYKEARARLGGDRVRYDFGLQGLDLVQSYDGTGAWKINPFQGRKDAERMSSDEARQLADAALIEGPLLASRHDGSRVQYLGREDFDGTLAYKLKVTQKDGDEFTYLLDPDTYLEIKVDETRRIRGAQQTTETELGDYEKVAGVYLPDVGRKLAAGATEPTPEGDHRQRHGQSGRSTPLSSPNRAPAALAKASARAAGRVEEAAGQAERQEAGRRARNAPASPSNAAEGEQVRCCVRSC